MNIELIKHLATLKVPRLYSLLVKFLRAHGYNVIRYPNFIMAEGLDPVCLIAHIDTVFKHVPDEDDFIYDAEKTVLWSPYGSGFDDRAGIAGIIELVQRGHRPHIVFTDKEEVGGIGASELIRYYPKCPFKNCKALIELDRKGENDCVFYSCDNKKFEKFIVEHDFETSWGTFSDISIISPSWKIASVNLSIGYLDEHTTSERLVCKWFDATIEKVSKIIEDIASEKKFKYVEKKYVQYPYASNFSTCLLCGKTLDPKTRYEIYDTQYPYSVCPDCYKQYYMGDEEDLPFN